MIRIILLVTFIASIVGIKDLKAETPIFNIVCTLAPDATFEVTTVKYSDGNFTDLEAGYYYRRTEAGNPTLCSVKKSNPGTILLNCEDQNSDETYQLLFTANYKNSYFEMQKISNIEPKNEKFKLCNQVKN